MMAHGIVYFSRAGRAGSDDLLVRTPELRPLRDAKIAVLGAGCLGAPSILEFARAGVGELRILDPDIVDPATISRWPLGIETAGKPKVAVLAAFIQRNYPSCRVTAHVHRIGGVRRHDLESPSDQDVLNAMCSDASLIYDATAEVGVQRFLSELAATLELPYVCLDGAYGGWGGKILSVIPGRTEGCWSCYRWALHEGVIPYPPSDPAGEIQPLGCGEVTFTGAGFDMAQIALTAVRTAVSTLCGGREDAYPATNWDVMTVAFRNEEGKVVPPRFQEYLLRKHPQCRSCNNV